MSLTTATDLAKRNSTMNLSQFQQLFRETEVPAPLSGETVQQYLGSFAPAEGDVNARRALSDRAREVQHTQAFLAEHGFTMPEDSVHMRGFYRHNPDDPTYDFMLGVGLCRSAEAHGFAGRVLKDLGEPPKVEELQQMSDEQVVENYPRLLQFAQIADSAQKLLEDNAFRAYHPTLQKLASMREELELTVRRMDLIASPYYAVANPGAMTNDGEIARSGQSLRDDRDQIVANSNGSVQPGQIEALAEYCDCAAAMQQAQQRYLGREMTRAMAEKAREGYGISQFSAPPTFYTVNGDQILNSDGTPAKADSDAVHSILRNGGAVIGMQGGRATQFSGLDTGGNLPAVQSGELTREAAENQRKNITSDGISSLLRDITAGDSVLLAFTGSRQYKELEAQTERFCKAYRGREISEMTPDERSQMQRDAEALHAASQNYLDYKYTQRGGDLSGSGRRFEKRRIDAALKINRSMELLTAELESEKRAVENKGAQMSTKDRIVEGFAKYFGQLAATSKSEAVVELATELRDNAALLGEYGTKVMNDEEKTKYQDLLSKMVTVNLLLTEQVAQNNGIAQPPAKFDQAYKADKEGLVKMISGLMPKEASEVSIYMLATGTHSREIGKIVKGVQNNMIEAAALKPEDPMLNKLVSKQQIQQMQEQLKAQKPIQKEAVNLSGPKGLF